MMRRSVYEPQDYVVVAYYAWNGGPVHFKFSFWGLPLGGAWRTARYQEYLRTLEALKSQGCQVHVWSPEHWPHYKDRFLNGSLYRENENAHTAA
jgi:hypothetical protein